MDGGRDSHGEAAAALARVVRGFGVPVLSQPDLLEGLLNDDVPQLPREVAMLTEAARHGIARLLAERVGQGIAAQAAASLAAAEITSRSAIDVAGARWAARVFADVAGYEVTGTGAAGTADTGTGDTGVADAGVPDTVVTPDLDVSGRVVRTTPPVNRSLGTAPPGSRQPGLAVAAGLAAGIASAMRLSWILEPTTLASGILFAINAVLALAAGVAAAILAARTRRGVTGLGAVLGAALPFAAYSVLLAAVAPELYFLPGTTRMLLVVTTWAGLIAALGAAVTAVTMLARRRELRRPSRHPLSLGVAAAGIAFPLTHILAQNVVGHEAVEGLFGSGVTGANVAWSLIFLLLYLLAGVIAAFLPAGSRSQVATWCGWLLVTAGLQVLFSPIEGGKAAPGLYLTWLEWLLVLAGTAALAVRAGQPSSSAAAAAAAAAPAAAPAS